MTTAQETRRGEAAAGTRRRRFWRGRALTAVIVTVAAGGALASAPPAHALTAQALDLGAYTLESAGSRTMVADVRNGSTAPGTTVDLSVNGNTENQVFHVVKVSPPDASQYDVIRVYSSSYTDGSVLASPVLLVSDQYMAGSAQCMQTQQNPTAFYPVVTSPCNASGVDSPNELWYAVFVPAIDSWELVSGASVQGSSRIPGDGQSYELTGSTLKSLTNDYEPLVMAPLVPAAGQPAQGSPLVLAPADSASKAWIGWNFTPAEYTVNKTVTIPFSDITGDTQYFPCGEESDAATDLDGSGNATYRVSFSAPSLMHSDKASTYAYGVNPNSNGDIALGKQTTNQLGLGETDGLSYTDFTIRFFNYSLDEQTASLTYFCAPNAVFTVSALNY